MPHQESCFSPWFPSFLLGSLLISLLDHCYTSCLCVYYMINLSHVGFWTANQWINLGIKCAVTPTGDCSEIKTGWHWPEFEFKGNQHVVLWLFSLYLFVSAPTPDLCNFRFSVLFLMTAVKWPLACFCCQDDRSHQGSFIPNSPPGPDSHCCPYHLPGHQYFMLFT